MKKKWVVGTRGSKLALRQTRIVIDALEKAHPGHEFTVRTIKTTGDTVWNTPLHLIGGKGLFVKEIEEELSKGGIDMAVHSMKDVPAELEKGLCIGAVLTREDPRDAFISSKHSGLGNLAEGCRVGTGSMRRKAQLLRYRKDINVVPLRGNVDTRIKKIEKENLDGIILAFAGLKRMGLENLASEIVPCDIMVPTCGQGAIGIETRPDGSTIQLLKAINDERSQREIAIERAIQARVGGGCHVPLGIHASLESGRIDLYLSLGNEDGNIVVHEKLSGDLDAEQAIIARASALLLKYSSK